MDRFTRRTGSLIRRYETFIDGFRIRYDYPAFTEGIDIRLKTASYDRILLDPHCYLEKWSGITYAEARDIFMGFHEGYEFFRLPCRMEPGFVSGCRLRIKDSIITITAHSREYLPPLFRNVHIAAK